MGFEEGGSSTPSSSSPDREVTGTPQPEAAPSPSGCRQKLGSFFLEGIRKAVGIRLWNVAVPEAAGSQVWVVPGAAAEGTDPGGQVLSLARARFTGSIHKHLQSDEPQKNTEFHDPIPGPA